MKIKDFMQGGQIWPPPPSKVGWSKSPSRLGLKYVVYIFKKMQLKNNFISDKKPNILNLYDSYLRRLFLSFPPLILCIFSILDYYHISFFFIISLTLMNYFF